LDGGSGAGVTINPVAFLVINNDTIKLMPINHTSTIDKLVDYIPDILSKIGKFGKDEKNSGKDDFQVKEEKIEEVIYNDKPQENSEYSGGAGDYLEDE
jgi:uncharacterized spore protein YtfJ